MINDPDQRAEFEADVAAVADALPALDPALRKVMAGFFELVGHQIDEVERIQQRCAQRVKRFTAFGTMEQSRGVARQLNDAIGAARALLKSSFTDSRLDIDVPLARHAISSVGALGFRIGDLSNPKPAVHGDTEVDLTSFAALTSAPGPLPTPTPPGPGPTGPPPPRSPPPPPQVAPPAMSDMLNHAITNGPVSLPDAVAMLDTAYLGHVIVLWSWALKQPNPDATDSITVRFRSLDGRDREVAVPRLTFTEPITTLAGASTVTTDAGIDFSSLPRVDQRPVRPSSAGHASTATSPNSRRCLFGPAAPCRIITIARASWKSGSKLKANPLGRFKGVAAVLSDQYSGPLCRTTNRGAQPSAIGVRSAGSRAVRAGSEHRPPQMAARSFVTGHSQRCETTRKRNASLQLSSRISMN